jgi:HSP20 family protein
MGNMSLIRRNNDRNDFFMAPWRELDQMRQQMDKLFEGSALATTDWTPSVDTSETDAEYRIRAALPDVKKEDVKVSLENGVLSIRGERKSRKEEKNEKIHRVEIAEGSFFRSFTMPADADAEKIAAKYENGMLDLTIAKSAEKKPATGRQITVR